jgi:predicted metalloprotease
MAPQGALAGGGLGMLVILVLALLFGANPMRVLQQVERAAPPPGAGAQGAAVNPEQEELKQFVGVVLKDTEDVWNPLFAQAGLDYPDPTLVMFSGATRSGCGPANAGMGPFYCPLDQKVYIDLNFYEELKEKFGAQGDFAQAYVIAHEVGHHVQNVLGITEKVQRLRTRMSQEEYNKYSVRLELQADFLAGVWAHHGQKEKQFLERGDIEEAMRCAAAIGDDAIQRRQMGYVVPDSFTHGSSEQRVRWFMKGLESGDMNAGDTFNVPEGQL